MKHKSIIGLCLIGCLVAYGGLKSYVYFGVKSEVDRLVHLVEPYIDIRYQAISSSLSGEISVEGITVIPRGAVEVVRIGSLQLTGDDFTFLLKMVAGLKMDKPPEKVRIAARRVDIPLDMLQLLAPESEAPVNRPKPCTLSGILSHAGLENLDYQRLVADVNIDYKLSAAAGEFSIHIGYWLQDVEDFQLDLSFTDVSAPGDIALGVLPKLSRGELRYQMASDYTRGMVNYCAKQAGKTPSVFLDSRLSMSDHQFAQEFGFVPGRGIRSALDKVIRQSAEVEIEIVPGGSFDLLKLKRFPPRQWAQLMGVEMSVGGRQVRDLSFTLPKGGDLGIAPIHDGQSASTSGRVPPVKPRFIETEMDRLADYIGRDIRIYTTVPGKPKRGLLNGVKYRAIEVEQRIHGGKMTIRIPFDKVNKVEVLRYK
ncbi:MAG: hypothetical protein ABW185_00135 [Sedimenticola sp.]